MGRSDSFLQNEVKRSKVKVTTGPSVVKKGGDICIDDFMFGICLVC